MGTEASGLGPTRATLQRVATHVLARARFAATGRFGLRVTPGGIGTPAFGPDGDVLRLAGPLLVHEHPASGGASTRVLAVPGRSLAELADFARVDLATPFSAGHDTPPRGDRDAPVELDVDAVTELMAWYDLGARALDQVLAHADAPSVVQLWPEHFDLGVDVATAHGRVNLGASPGDDAHPAPYLYVGPWEADRPGDADYWNAPFGAVADHASITTAPDPVAAAVAFLQRGLALLA
jgi:hypothetical protein